MIFDDRPYVAYEVWPTKTVTPTVYMSYGEIETLLNGKMKITFTAYNPFGRMLVDRYDGNVDFSGAMADTGILNSTMMPAAPTVEDRSFLIYNCGTEPSAVTIRIAGDVDTDTGLTITNTANGTACKIIGLTSSAVPEGAWLEVDGEHGQVVTVIGEERRLAFEYHDLGYLQMDPCMPIARDVLVSYEAGSRILTNNIEAFADVEAGQYIYVDGKWRYIGRVLDAGRIELNSEMDITGVGIADIATMNLVTVEGTATLTKFEIEITPRTR